MLSSMFLSMFFGCFLDVVFLFFFCLSMFVYVCLCFFCFFLFFHGITTFCRCCFFLFLFILFSTILLYMLLWIEICFCCWMNMIPSEWTMTFCFPPFFLFFLFFSFFLTLLPSLNSLYNNTNTHIFSLFHQTHAKAFPLSESVRRISWLLFVLKLPASVSEWKKRKKRKNRKKRYWIRFIRTRLYFITFHVLNMIPHTILYQNQLTWLW